jgi:hypothetical protein
MTYGIFCFLGHTFFLVFFNKNFEKIHIFLIFASAMKFINQTRKKQAL